MMKFLYRADQVLIDRVFQPIVDRTQAKPRVLARQCAIGFFVCLLLRAGLYLDFTEGWGVWFYVVVSIVIVSGMYLLSGSDEALAIVGASVGWRWWFCLLLFSSVTLLVLAPSGSFACRAAMDSMLTAFFFFAACRPPKPPKRKTEPARREVLHGA